MELMKGGEIYTHLAKEIRFSEKQVKFFCACITLALGHLHANNFIYRDLKLENILLDEKGYAKLTDFGLSKVCFSRNQMAYSMCVTPEYIAPEIIQGKGYNQAADWFSFVILLLDRDRSCTTC